MDQELRKDAEAAAPAPQLERRVLVLSPMGRDAEMLCNVLRDVGIDCATMANVAELARELERGAAVIIVAEEALAGAQSAALMRYVETQEPWADLPILLLTHRGAGSHVVRLALEHLGNVMLLERPLQRATLVSAVRSGLRASERQYQIRNYVAERERTAALLAKQTRQLEEDLRLRERIEASLRQSEALYRGIGESIDFGVWLSDASGRATYVSESFLKLIGATLDDVKTFGWTSYLHPDDVDATTSAWLECAVTGRPWSREHRFRLPDGSYHPILARGVPILDADGQITAWAGINLDIAELKRAEDALRDADRRKDEFLATLAHELRNPLAPIRNAVHVLHEQSANANSMVRWAHDIIERQVRHLARLVDDLLDVSRITQGKITLRTERLAVEQIIRAAVDTSRPLIDAGGHTLQVNQPERPIHVDGDLVRLAQSLSNLLNNAAKYTPRGGELRIDVTVEHKEVAIAVCDNGIGIAPDVLPSVFEMFSQAERSLERSQGGLGIGLTLVRSFVELHGGRVSAESGGVGCGSAFTIRLPLAEPVEQAATAPLADIAPKASPQHARDRVLVVDDNVDGSETLAALLRISGYDVRVVHDGLAAVNAHREFNPALILLDIGLPGLNGYEVAERIRQHDREVTIFAVTGWGQQADRDRSREAGCNEHLTKPIDPPALLGYIADRLDGRRATPARASG